MRAPAQHKDAAHTAFADGDESNDRNGASVKASDAANPGPPVFYRLASASPTPEQRGGMKSGPVCGDLGTFPSSCRIAFLFPRRYMHSYENTRGASRLQGGHECKDLMAPTGTAEYAVTDGTIVPVAGANENGWNTVIAMNPYPLLEWIKASGDAITGSSNARYCEAPRTGSLNPSTGRNHELTPGAPGVSPDLDTGSNDPTPSPAVEKWNLAPSHSIYHLREAAPKEQYQPAPNEGSRGAPDRVAPKIDSQALKPSSSGVSPPSLRPSRPRTSRHLTTSLRPATPRPTTPPAMRRTKRSPRTGRTARSPAPRTTPKGKRHPTMPMGGNKS